MVFVRSASLIDLYKITLNADTDEHFGSLSIVKMFSGDFGMEFGLNRCRIQPSKKLITKRMPDMALVASIFKLLPRNSSA